MKFVSKYNRYKLFLRQSIPADRSSGRPMQPGLSVMFEGGMADVKDEDIVQMMIEHPLYRADFVSVEEGTPDPYAQRRKSSEPEHTMMELQHGSVVGTVNAKPRVRLNPDQQKAVQEMAVEMAKQMAPVMAKEILKGALSEVKEKNVKRGRPPKDKTETESQEEESITNAQKSEAVESSKDAVVDE